MAKAFAWRHRFDERKSIQDRHDKLAELGQSGLHISERYYPEVAAKIKACNPASRLKNDGGRDRWKWVPVRCRQIPWCVPCSVAEADAKTWRTLERFEEACPADQEPRFLHIVQTAPVTEDGKGWGMQARRFHRTFLKIVWQTAEETFGKGSGAYLSYHDFGNRFFEKPHPHVDFTMNGWRIGHDGPEKIDWPFTAGQRKWLTKMQERSSVFGFDEHESPGNVDAGRFATGAKTYAPILRYQMRQILDFRSVEYAHGEMRWNNYREGTVTTLTPQQFFAGIRDYENRLGRFRGKPQQRLTVGKGHFGQRQREKTRKAMGGVQKVHRDECTCPACGDWFDAGMVVADGSSELRPLRDFARGFG